MGRGRAKAKQTKVARELKYGGPQTDLSRLQAELGSPVPVPVDVEDDEDEAEIDVPSEFGAESDDMVEINQTTEFQTRV